MKTGRLDHKTKMISVRLSEVELGFLKTQYPSYGARSVSDLARLAVQRMMQESDSSAADIAAKVNSFNEALTRLQSRVSRLETKLLWERETIAG